MVKFCSACGNPLPEGARFCPNCGAAVGSLGGTEERKMVTVLFIDIVNSTSYARRLDPERSREVLAGFFEAVNEELLAHRGQPEKFIGDAVMAVFGLPQVREDDALRAVRAGLAIRGRARRLGEATGLAEPVEVRIGIEAGEAATGRSLGGQLLVTGPVVNLAARLQSAAQPGQLLVGSTAHALTTATVSYGRRRRIRAKGFEYALDAFPVEGLSTRSARRTIPFVGRASEAAMLNQSLSLASSTGRPVLVTLVGEPGIGKSRLTDEFAAGVGAAVAILRGQARSYTDTATFSPAAAIIADLARIEGGDPPERIRRQLRQLVDRCCASPDGERTARRLGLLFGVAERGDEESFVHDVQRGFAAVVDGLARVGSLVVIFEDAHGLQPPMLDLIERLAATGQPGPRPLLILAAGRNELLELRPNWGATSENALLLRLDPLSAEESMRLVRQAGGGHIGDSEAREIAEHAGGNAFFIIEMTGMISARRKGGSDGDRTALPPTVQAVVSARLDALPVRLRELARRASIFIHSFGLEELAWLDEDANVAELQELEDAEVIVREQRTSSVPTWRMRHATLKEVAYASLPKRERLRLHQLVARTLMDTGYPRLAPDHLELAAKASLDLDPDDRTVPELAADALVAAGDRARRRMEVRPAIDRYERALTMTPSQKDWGAREARVLAGLGEARYWLGEYRSATGALEQAVTLAEAHRDWGALALALRFQGDIALNQSADADKAEKLLERSLLAAEQLGEVSGIVRTLLFAGWVPWTRRRYAEAERIWTRALRMADAKDRWAQVRGLTALSITRNAMKDHVGALRLIDEATVLAEESGDHFILTKTHVQRARVMSDLGRREEALPWFDRAVAAFADLGAPWEQADAMAGRGTAKRELGRLDEAEEDLKSAIRIATELGDRLLIGRIWRALARLADSRGDAAEAEEHRRRSREAESGLIRS